MAKANEEEKVTTPVEETEVQAVETTVDETAEEQDTKTAKAGKRSEKGLKEAAEKQAKIESQKDGKHEADVDAENKPKQIAKPTRSRLERQGKNFRKAAEQVDKTKTYSLEETLELATKTNPAKFDATVELHINLGVDPRHADQNIRDNLVLPNGTGKTVRVAVFSDDKVEGADLNGVEAITKALDKGELNFDVLIATPAQMPKLGKYARTLGPRGLMPNPKSGTVTNDVAKAVKEAKAGRIEYRVDSTGIVHVGVGKVSFGKDKLVENAQALLASIKGNKPQSIKSNYIKAVHLATTMGPSIKVDQSSL